MKINEIRIDHFGNIKDTTIKLNNTFNFIYGVNEADKKSLINFIRIMFYGTIYNFRKNHRVKYTHSDGSCISGSIVLECDNNTYVLERKFDPTDYTNDKTSIKNVSTNKTEYLPCTASPGEKIFKIDKHMFERNSYINESESIAILKTAHTDVMSSIFSNFISTTNESVSSARILKRLQNYYNSPDKMSLSSVINEKRASLLGLQSDLQQAQKDESDKLKLQGDCIRLKEKYDSFNLKYENLKLEIDIQDMLFELDRLHSYENSHQNFLEISRLYDQKSSQFSETRANKNKKAFSRCRESLNSIKAVMQEKEVLEQKKQRICKDLEIYTPADNADILDSICDTNGFIEDTKYSLSQLQTEYENKERALDEIKKLIMQEGFKLQTAETDYTHFQEVSKHKLLLAEEKLHNASHAVNLEPIHASNNLVYASVLLIGLSLMLIIFMNNLFVLSCLILGIVTCIYAIIVKVRKERKINISRVDENVLRNAEIEMRTLKNKYTTDSDRHKSLIALEKKKLFALEQQKNSIISEMNKLKEKIAQCERNLNFYHKQKSLEESKIASPDPKFFLLKTDIKNVENNINKCSNKFNELSDQIMTDISEISNIRNINEALEYIDKAGTLEDELNVLNQRLLKYNNKEQLEADNVEIKSKIDKLNCSIKELSKNKNVSKVTDDELIELKNTANALLEKALTIKNEYIDAVTAMKIQYKDSKNIACIEKEISHIEQELAELKKHQDSVENAISGYKEAFDEMNKKYIPRIIKKASEILVKLTEGKYSELIITSDFNVVIKDKDHKKINFETLSKSVCDQIYFSLRIAVSEMTTKYIFIPVILDDIFLCYDDKKSIQLLNFLMNYSSKSQILMFSCHNLLSKIADVENIPLDNVNMISLKK